MTTAVREVVADFPEKLQFLFEPHSYKVAYGGRMGTKSWGFARALLIQAAQRKLRILCTRETQSSIRESVHQILSEQISLLGLGSEYHIQQNTISARTGSEFVFAGLREGGDNVKSYEGFDIVWIEEAQKVTKRSLDNLIPTVMRRAGAEIWITFNPEFAADEVYKRFVNDKPADSVVMFTSWKDNLWLSETAIKEIADTKRRSEDDYEHIYGGTLRQVVDGAIYKQEIIQAEKDGQFCRVPWDKAVPVNTFWDLGFGDNTSILFEQSIGFEFRFIDHISGSLKALGHYLKQMQERGYTYGMHFLPWDGARGALGTGRSIREQMEAVYGKGNVFCVKKLPINDGIEAVRAIFPKCFFDSEKCAEFIRSLRHYRYVYDEKLLTFQRTPLHDWASHDADALRTAAVGVKEQERPKEQQYQPGRSSYGVGRSDGGWMA